MKTILYSDDINLLAYWEKSFHDECKIVYEIEELKSMNSSFIVMNYCVCNSTCIELIRHLSKEDNQLLVLHRVPDLDTAKQLLKAGAKGYGNALMDEHYLNSAKRSIKDGLIWLHPEFTSQLILQIPATKEQKQKEKLDKLTQREREVALLLKDGYTYKDVANELNITPRTIKAHANSIYKKLNLKDRLALALLLR